uniref:Mannose receptor, C type 1b n=1 Tax=Eptatretus burgeri TaxID=7764 RepID=A0A8C4QLD3_EPTBU
MYHNGCFTDLEITITPSSMVQNQILPTPKTSNHLMNVVSKLCLTASGVEDYDLVAASKCQSNNSAQAWECRDLDLLVLQGRFIHLNWPSMGLFPPPVLKFFILLCITHCFLGFFPEVFTIGGNSRGEPCVFPFAYGGNIYDQCTFAGRNDRQLWCATTDDYNQDNLFGFCPNNGDSCDVFWHEDPRYNGCYEMNVEAVLSWYEAQRLCQQQGADLLSISDVHTQHFISGFLSGHGASLWIGLNVLDPQGGWQWVDDAPFRYVNWAEGEKSSFVFQIKQKLMKEIKIEGWGVNRRGCAPGWMAYGTFCYHLVEKPSSWKDALIFCRASRGDLASLVSEPDAMLWIGLNSHRDGNTFDWSDGSPVDVTHWQVNHPVVTSLRPPGVKTQHSHDSVRCHLAFFVTQNLPLPGWKKHGFSCFLIGKAPVGFELATKYCVANGGYLASILIRGEQAFISSLLGLPGATEVWLGLSDKASPNSFIWHNGDPVTFTNWAADQPGSAAGCVVASTGRSLGLWFVRNCDDYQAVPLCKTPVSGMVAPTASHSSILQGSCPTGWQSQENLPYFCCFVLNFHICWEFYLFIYLFCQVHIIVSVSTRRAEGTEVWIGLNSINPELGFTWADGSPVSEGMVAKILTCDFSGEETGEWRSVGCEDPRAFICRKHNVTGLAPPQASLNKPQGGCPQRWKLFNNKVCCKPDFKSWKHARDSCKDEGGDLVSITNVDEQMFMVVQLQEAKFKLWTGLNDIKQEGYFVWSDGTPVNYTNWSDGRPVKSPQDLPYEVNPTIAVIKPHPVTELVHFGKSFFRVDTTPQPFAAARKACQSTGADIASLISIYEHAFVSLLARRAGGALWIGLNANETAGAYHWLDGWHMPMSGWATNEPAQPRACVRLVAGEGWMTESCSKPLPVVCKKSAGGWGEGIFV